MKEKIYLEKSGGGISVVSILGIIFVVLKITGYITWSWWWVLLPFYGPLALILVFLIFAGIIFTIAHSKGGK